MPEKGEVIGGAPLTAAYILAAAHPSLPNGIAVKSYPFAAADVGNVLNATGFGGTPNALAIVDMQSTTQGFLPPRMTTTQRNAINSPPEGLVIYNLTTHKLNVFTGSVWEQVTSA
jgi:hypothetical protein